MDEGKPGPRGAGIGHNMPSAQARMAIANAVCSEVRQWRVSQQRAAQRLGVHRTVLNRLLNGDVGRFALGSLYDMAAAAGIEIQLIIRGEIQGELAAASLRPEPPFDRGALFGLADGNERDRSKLRYAALAERCEQVG